MDASVKVALIVALPPLITSVGALVMGVLNFRSLRVVHESVDGKLSQLIETKEKLSHAEGKSEGIESERGRN